MNVIAVVRKYIIKDLTGVIRNYYIQDVIDTIKGGKACQVGYWPITASVYAENFSISCYKGHFDIVKMMLSKNGNRNFYFYGEALWYASIGSRELIVRFLLHKRRFEKEQLERALIGACNGGNLEIVKMLTKYKKLKKPNRLHEAFESACLKGFLDIVRYLSRKYIISDELAMRGFRLACKYGRTETVRYLVKYWKFPFYWGFLDACEKGREDIVKHLFSLRERYRPEDLNLSFGMMNACENGHLGIVDLILEHIKESDRKWNDWLYYAAYGGYTEIVKRMMEKADDWNEGLKGAEEGEQNETVLYITQRIIEKERKIIEECDIVITDTRKEIAELKNKEKR